MYLPGRTGDGAEGELSEGVSENGTQTNGDQAVMSRILSSPHRYQFAKPQVRGR
jgi:hypothetical protein